MILLTKTSCYIIGGCQSLERTCFLHIQEIKTYTLKLKTASEILVTIYEATWRHKLEDQYGSESLFNGKRWHVVSVFLTSLFIAYLNILRFNPEDGGSTFLRNVGKFLPDYMDYSP
jgi:hypothetical protein